MSASNSKRYNNTKSNLPSLDNYLEAAKKYESEQYTRNPNHGKESTIMSFKKATDCMIEALEEVYGTNTTDG